MRNPVHTVLAVALLSNIGVQAQRILLVLYLIHLGAQPLIVGALVGTFGICHALMGVHVGRLVDRRGSRMAIMVGVTIGAAGMMLPFFFPAIAAVFAAAVAGSVAVSITHISLQSLVGQLSTPQTRTQNFANYSLTNSLTGFVGPMLAGFGIDHLGHAWTCLAVALAFLATVPLVALGGGTTFDRRSAHHTTGEHKPARLWDLLKMPGLLRSAMLGGTQNLGDVLFQFYLPIYATSIGLSASVIGVILSMNAAAGFAVRAFLTRLIRHFGEAGLLRLSFYLATASLLLVPLFESAWMLGALTFVFGLGLGCSGPICTMMLFSNAPPGRSAETMGVKAIFNQGTRTVGPVIMGAVAGAAGLLAVFWLTAVMMAYGGWISAARRQSGQVLRP